MADLTHSDGAGARLARTWLTHACTQPWQARTFAPGSRLDPQRAHHLVVLVLEDVAVPDEEPGVVEARLDAGDLVGVGDDRVLVAGLPRLGGPSRSAERLPVHDLELHLVDVDRVGVLGEVVDLPELDRAAGPGSR